MALSVSREVLAVEMPVPRLAGMHCKQEGNVRIIRVEQEQFAQIVSVVAGHGVQALEDSVASLEIGFLHESPRCSIGWCCDRSQLSPARRPRATSERWPRVPRFKYRRHASQGFHAAWLAVGKLVSPDHDGD